MDEDNFNTSFDGLFEENAGGGWIITKNENGRMKAARCAEDEMDDFYITRTEWFVRKDDEAPPGPSDNVPKWRLYGTAMFLVRDMLNCETRNGYFICKNIPFIGVILCGTVVSLSTRYDKYAITVDDGTSSIMCLIKKEELQGLQFTEEEKQRNREVAEALNANPDDPYIKMEYIVTRATEDLLKNIPTFDELGLGDIVTIIGTLSEYKNNRYIFIKSIVKEPEDSLYHITYLEDMMQLYQNEYADS